MHGPLWPHRRPYGQGAMLLSWGLGGQCMTQVSFRIYVQSVRFFMFFVIDLTCLCASSLKVKYRTKREIMQSKNSIKK